MDCQGLHRTCRKCGFRFKGWDPTDPCPYCGTSRKCNHQAVIGYRFCQNHGGPSPKNNFYGLGVAVSVGNTSHFPLTRLAAKKNEMERSGAILSNRKSIEIVRRRIEELLERIDKNEAPDRLFKLHELWQDYRAAQIKGDELKKLQAGRALEAEFEAAYHDYAAWRQMFEALDLDRKMVESEVKIAKDLHAILTAEDAYDLVADIFAIILRVENDPDKLKRYQYELTRLVGDGFIVEATASDPDA